MEFVMAPNLHWPDTMFSFDHGTGKRLITRHRAAPPRLGADFDHTSYLG